MIILTDKKLRELHNNWDDIPLVHTRKPIYHYTSKNGLEGIFRNRQLWANDIYRQNDKSEGIYVLDVLKKNINSFGIQEDFKEAILKQVEILKPSLKEGFYNSEKYRSFIISFSTSGDELALWNYYTKNEDSTGYNIAFNTKVLTDHIKIKKLICDNETGLFHPSIEEKGLYHGKVIYKEHRQCEIMRNEIKKFEKYYDKNNDICEYMLVDKLLWVGTFFKSPYFEHEYEYRLAFFTGTDVEYPETNGIAIEVKGQKKNHIEVYYNPDSIMFVTCSPTNKQEDIDFPCQFKTEAFPNFKTVQISNIPFRVI